MNEPPNPEVAIFAAALELPANQRGEYLDQTCAGNVELRRQVEALLRVHDDAGNFFDKLAPMARPMSADVPMPDSSGTIRLPGIPTEKSGDRIGHYKLLQQIGEGGCGVVYMAEQEEPVRRRVALKVIKLGMDTKSVIARFEAERQALALMDHPNIAKVLEAGATDIGRPYFVMELVRGIKITDYCDENNLSTPARLELFIQVCQAIQHAHQKGIIHRDIKPSNILVADHDGVPVPKIIDFGIAKATTDQRLTDKTLFTAFEQFIGTPAYMSPEQAKLSGLDIDTRSDIYSLGVLLYELLTGKTPFAAERLLEAGLDEIRRIIREEEPSKPSTKVETLDAAEKTTVARHRQSDPPKLAHLIRGDLDWIVMKALEKDRSRRYETANGLAIDIQRHLGNEPVLARPPSAGYRLQKAWRRNKTAFAVATLTAAVLLAATGVSTWQAVRASRAETLAQQRLMESEANAKLAKQRLVESEANAALAQQRLAESRASETLATERLAESEAISKFLTEVFQSPDPARDGRTITVAETLSNATMKLETELTNQPARRAKLQSTLGLTFHAMGLEREAITLQEKVRDYYLAASGLEHPDTIEAMNALALSYHHAGRLNEALKMREQVLELCRKVHGPDHYDTLIAMQNLAISYDYAGRREEARTMQEDELALCRKTLGPEHPDTLGAMQNLATTYGELGRQEEALKLREEVLALCRKLFPPENQYRLAAMQNLVISYNEAGRREEALKLLEEVLALRRKVDGPEHPATLRAMNYLAICYTAAGRLDEALKTKEEVLALLRKVSGPENPDTLQAMYNLANAYANAGRRDEALKLREQVLALYRKVYPPEHPDTLSAMLGLADSYVAAGRLDEGLKLGEEALALRRKVLPPEHPDTLRAMGLLANFYYEAGRLDEALKLREESLALFRKISGPENPNTLTAMANLANSYFDAGRRDEALKLREEALAVSRKRNGLEHPDTLLAMINLANSYNEASRWDEARKLLEEALPVCRKLCGPEHPITLGAMDNLANAYCKAGRWDEASKLLEEALPLSRKLRGPKHSDTLWVMKTLADSYTEAGRNKEATALLENIFEVNSKDTDSSLTLAILQTWFGQDADYEATRRRLVRQAVGTDQADTAERAAKAASLRPSTDSTLLTNTLNLAQRAVELGKDSPSLPRYQLSLGMAEYRADQYAAAERSLTIAGQTAGGDDEIPVIAHLYDAMTLFRLNRAEEARKVFRQAETQMPPLPKDDSKLVVDGKSFDHNLLVMWLAYREAKALMEAPSVPVAAPPAPK